MSFEKLLIFICSKAAKADNEQLSYRIASRLEGIGIARIGTFPDLSKQRSSSSCLQSKMIFINNCRAACVRVLAHGLDNERYLFFDVSEFLTSGEFDVDEYINTVMVPKINNKWY